MSLLHHSSASMRLLVLLLVLLPPQLFLAAAGKRHGGMRLPLGALVDKIYWQRLDHFSYAPEREYETFPQRYYIYDQYYNSPSSWRWKNPIIVYTGGEWDISGNLVGNDFPMHVGSRLGALVVYMEHRYYGLSNPFGSETEAYKNGSTLAYLTAAQALADFAAITLQVMNDYCPVAACPVIAMGCSYGGMLAAWFRLKYPHLIVGSLASSAPVFAPDGDVMSRSNYYDTASEVFKNASLSCYRAIKNSWTEIDAAGVRSLRTTFNLCSQLNHTWELKHFLHSKYLNMAQYRDPIAQEPESFCSFVDNTIPTPRNPFPSLEKIAGGVQSYFGPNCVNISAPSFSPILPLSPGSGEGWAWQTCTEMVFPFGSHPPKSMFQTSFFDYNSYVARCQRKYKVTPRPDWIPTTFNISQHLDGFAGNIIFSNGLKDPYSSEGVLSDVSSTIVALFTKEGAHCTDMSAPKPNDVQELVLQRRREISLMEGWIRNYKSPIHNITTVMDS